jgi:hypothetical protein
MKENIMKKKHNLFLGFTVLLLAVILSFSGCDTETDDESGGKLTINNYPGIIFTVGVYDFSGRISNYTEYQNTDLTGKRIAAGGQEKSPVSLTTTLSDGPTFSRNGTFLIQLWENTSVSSLRFFSQVQFVNGSATINWDSGYKPHE